MPKAYIDKKTDIPEGREDDYEEVDGGEGYRLIVKEAGGYQLAQVSELQSGLIKEREETAKFRRKLGETKAVLKKLEESKGEAGKLSDEEREGLQNQVSTLTEQNGKLRDSHKKATMKSIADAAIEEHRGNGQLLRPHVMAALDGTYDDDGKLVVRVIGEDGMPLFSRQPDRSNELMKTGEHVAILKRNATYKEMFLGPMKKGTDAPTDGAPADAAKTEELNKLSPTEAINRLREEQTA